MKRALAVVSLVAASSACSAGAPTAPTEATSAVEPAAPPSPPSAPAAVTTAPPAPAAATAAATASAAASAVAAAEPADVPRVKLENIGMHIGGGPNDAATKEPIKKSVAPHFDELKRCWVKVDQGQKGGDFGVDVLIDKDGGKPLKLSHQKTTLKGDGFKDCMTAVFESIDFLKPKKGKTTVSYSVRFTPER